MVQVENSIQGLIVMMYTNGIVIILTFSSLSLDSELEELSGLGRFSAGFSFKAVASNQAS